MEKVLLFMLPCIPRRAFQGVYFIVHFDKCTVSCISKSTEPECIFEQNCNGSGNMTRLIIFVRNAINRNDGKITENEMLGQKY